MSRKKTPKKKKGKNTLGINNTNFKIFWNRNFNRPIIKLFQSPGKCNMLSKANTFGFLINNFQPSYQIGHRNNIFQKSFWNSASLSPRKMQQTVYKNLQDHCLMLV